MKTHGSLIALFVAFVLCPSAGADWFDDFEAGQVGDPLSSLGYGGDYGFESTIDWVGVGGSKGVLVPTPDWFGWPGAYLYHEPGMTQIGDSVAISVDMRFQVAENIFTVPSLVPVAELFLSNSDWSTLMTAQFVLSGSGNTLTEYGIRRWDSGDIQLLDGPLLPISELGTSGSSGELSDYFKLKFTATKTGYQTYDTCFELVNSSGVVLTSLEETAKNLDHMFWSDTLHFRFGHFGGETFRAADFLHFDNFEKCVTLAQDYPVFADSGAVTRGSGFVQDVTTLYSSDNVDTSVSRASADVQSVTELTILGTSPVADPTSMEIVLEGSVFARTGVTQIVELYNLNTDSWDTVDSRPASRFGDQTVNISVTGDLSCYVQDVDFHTRARVRYQSLNNRQRFSSNTDRFHWVFSGR